MTSRTDLLAAGISSNEVQRNVRGGHWRRIRAGIYATVCVDGRNAWQQNYAGELCWGGDGAAISHRAAAFVFGLDGFLNPPAGRPDIVVPASSACRGATVHRSTMTIPTVSVFDLRVVSPEACLAQLGHRATEAEVELAMESALRHGITSVARLHEAAFGSLARMDGARALREILRRRPPDAPATASSVETTVLQLLRNLGCRHLERSVSIGSEDFSFVVRKRRLAVSCSTANVALPPSDRRAGLASTGWTIVEISMAELLADRDAVAERLQSALVRTQRGPARPRPRSRPRHLHLVDRGLASEPTAATTAAITAAITAQGAAAA